MHYAWSIVFSVALCDLYSKYSIYIKLFIIILIIYYIIYLNI